MITNKDVIHHNDRPHVAIIDNHILFKIQLLSKSYIFCSKTDDNKSFKHNKY